jgi:Tfp pilus assembly protein PilO
MKDFPLKKRVILAALAILLVADGALAFFNLRMSDNRQSPDQVLAVQNRQLNLLRADVKRASDIRKKVPDYLVGLDKFEASLPSESNGYSIVSQEIGEVAKSTHLTVDNIKFNQKNLPNRNLDQIHIDIIVAGDYNGIVRFLNVLQRSKNAYIVETLELESQVASPAAPGSLRISVHLITYFRTAV